jgi:nicotinamide mononucleotide transporter
MLTDTIQSIYKGLLDTGWVEAVAVISGIVSVWFSKKENILVYPTGLMNTLLYIYLSYKGHLFGEASVNVYYTIMSIYGWYLWTLKKEDQKTLILQISKSSKKEWIQQLVFFSIFYVVIFIALTIAKAAFAPEAIPWADAFASATAYTGMWLMAKKKVESWVWWIATNLSSIPLYFIKGYAFTSVQFIILLILAIAGWQSWNQKANQFLLKAKK